MLTFCFKIIYNSCTCAIRSITCSAGRLLGAEAGVSCEEIYITSKRCYVCDFGAAFKCVTDLYNCTVYRLCLYRALFGIPHVFYHRLSVATWWNRMQPGQGTGELYSSL